MEQKNLFDLDVLAKSKPKAKIHGASTKKKDTNTSSEREALSIEERGLSGVYKNFGDYISNERGNKIS